MPSSKELRLRLVSVKNTQQITRAMKMVAAAKLRHAQDAILAARPYAQRVERVLLDLADSVTDDAHPLLESRRVKKVLLVVLTSDRGLCGGFNSGIIKKAERSLNEYKANGKEVQFCFIGRKGHLYFKNRGVETFKVYDDVISKVTFQKSREIAELFMQCFLNGDFDEIRFIFNEFKSAIVQDVVDTRFLPLRVDDEGLENLESQKATADFIYEPDQKSIFETLLPRHFHSQVYRSLLESVASEHGSRMSAMEAATKNAGEMIKSLNLTYNRLRQSAITTELTEIVSGAEALD